MNNDSSLNEAVLRVYTDYVNSPQFISDFYFIPPRQRLLFALRIFRSLHPPAPP